MIVRAESCVTVSSTWLAKNIIAISMIANSSPKNSGATSANSTAATPRRLRWKRRKAFLVAARDNGIDAPRTSGKCRKDYLKVIVEVFRGAKRNNPFR